MPSAGAGRIAPRAWVGFTFRSRSEPRKRRRGWRGGRRHRRAGAGPRREALELHSPLPPFVAVKASRRRIIGTTAGCQIVNPLEERICKLLILLVRLGGLEPPTKSLGNSCSFHLSYSRPRAIILGPLQNLRTELTASPRPPPKSPRARGRARRRRRRRGPGCQPR